MGAGDMLVIFSDGVTEASSQAGEDFGEFGKAAAAPSFMFWVGGVPAAKLEEVQGDVSKLPSLHSALWAPDPEPTLKAGAAALTVGVLELLGNE